MKEMTLAEALQRVMALSRWGRIEWRDEIEFDSDIPKWVTLEIRVLPRDDELYEAHKRLPLNVSTELSWSNLSDEDFADAFDTFMANCVLARVLEEFGEEEEMTDADRAATDDAAADA